MCLLVWTWNSWHWRMETQSYTRIKANLWLKKLMEGKDVSESEVKWSLSVFVTPWTVAFRLLCPWGFPGKNTGVSCHFLLQGIFWTQGSNVESPALQADSTICKSKTKKQKDVKRDSFKWSGAAYELQDYFQHGSPVKSLQGRLGESTSNYCVYMSVSYLPDI